MTAGKWRYSKQAATPGKVCKDCGPGSKRPAPHPGPRCATHHRERQRARRLASAASHVERTYRMTSDQYDALYAAQGGRCAICRRATGASKRLAVDHDHSCCPGKTTCGRCTRGLVCSICNDILAHFRDDPAAFDRGADYLRNWPSRKISPQSRGVV